MDGFSAVPSQEILPHQARHPLAGHRARPASTKGSPPDSRQGWISIGVLSDTSIQISIMSALVTAMQPSVQSRVA